MLFVIVLDMSQPVQTNPTHASAPEIKRVPSDHDLRAGSPRSSAVASFDFIDAIETRVNVAR